MHHFHTTVHEDILNEIGSHRVDVYLQKALDQEYPGLYTRSLIHERIKAGDCKINDKVVMKSGASIKLGDQLSIYIDTFKTTLIPDESVNFEVVYEDEDVLVINKPRGLIVHPARGVKESTLVHGLYAKINKDNFSGDLDSIDRLGIVHRLDKETSGLMVVAKSIKSKKNLQEQLRPPRSMSRTYHAICVGAIKQKRGLESATGKSGGYNLKAPLARDPRNRIKYTVDFTNKLSREAESNFRVIKTQQSFSLVECVLVTGRTHQIRAHLEYLGIPIVGDKVYRAQIDKKILQTYPSIEMLRGQLLHAKSLSFVHPSSEQRMSFEASYPEDFESTWKLLSQ